MILRRYSPRVRELALGREDVYVLAVVLATRRCQLQTAPHCPRAVFSRNLELQSFGSIHTAAEIKITTRGILRRVIDRSAKDPRTEFLAYICRAL
jgi:hypothetical protein